MRQFLRDHWPIALALYLAALVLSLAAVEPDRISRALMAVGGAACLGVAWCEVDCRLWRAIRRFWKGGRDE